MLALGRRILGEKMKFDLVIEKDVEPNIEKAIEEAIENGVNSAHAELAAELLKNGTVEWCVEAKVKS